ncbi:LysR family transcriptional regulator [Litorimonas cladophorae]|uniref:LysR family transcriptional regulator n=1 Tax=Litorimonas cladophorae TaxID=1220491 RepID=A0A918KHZ1_9PROT|nr:LysR family transcriptional regulator [Litorimonas cladophorae]GGX63274.1 LysR family transcriptional regulator [Litorimonas cladophorae]
MRFEKLDLNLLVVLDALLEEQSVSIAAERLNLSQSGASAALSRLREFFEDDLLVSSGRTMTCTPRGEALIEPVKAALNLIRETIITPEQFNPATSDRTISIASIDAVTNVLLTEAVGLFSREAPNMRFKVLPLAEEPATMLPRGQADIIILIDYLADADLPKEFLFEEDFVAIAWDKNPLIEDELTSDLYAELGHVSVHLNHNVPGFDETALRRIGVNRNIEAFAPSFASVPRFVIKTNRIAMIHRRLATQVSSTLPIRLYELPFEFPKVREVVQWSAKNTNDEAVRWVVRRLQEIAKDLDY